MEAAAVKLDEANCDKEVSPGQTEVAQGIRGREVAEICPWVGLAILVRDEADSVRDDVGDGVSEAEADAGVEEVGGKRRDVLLSAAKTREELLSKIAVGDVPSPPEARIIAERSLKGLVVFLTTYFCHLPTENAMSYLYLARADLLVAVRLIEIDRCLRQKYQFCILSHATKAALRCAALAAGVTMVDSFLGAMFGLGTDVSIKKVPAALMESLRGVLLDRVHDLYLKAVSRLPMKELRISHHRGLLKAGYCYGPFNPVWNIIVNTIWYNTAFPACEEFEVDMISMMRHVESRVSQWTHCILVCIYSGGF
ncbi:hypothetical protein PR202_gb06332 [Eleusine coracana subsp. coracana]|uniref:PIR2-like helical domain-containing protein n=1 Tax=Eleusine coracana subsp. coracana TaxID=191504 RepID=A0AAV5E6T4_ELECO|nr:hypothetical protein PR202_gb06332 [Eleusine coracana subsp. coracana]